MSLPSLSAVSSIQTTGKSITIANTREQDDLDPGAELALTADGRVRGLAGDARVGQVAALDMGRHGLALLEAVEVAQVELRGDDHDDHHQDSVRGRAPGVEAEERDLVDVERQRLGRAARAALGEDVDQVEEAEGLDRPEHHRDQQQRPHQRERDPAELEPLRGAVDLRRLVEVLRHRGQAGERDQHDERRPLPGVDDDQRQQREPLLREPLDAVEAEAVEEGVHDAELRVEHELPEQADDDRREHHRDQEQRRERAPPAHAARDQVGDREPERRLQEDRAGDEEGGRDRALAHDRRRQDVGVVLEADPVVADIAGRRVVREGQQDQPDQRPDREEDQDRHRRRDEQRGEPSVLQPAEAPGGGRRHEPVRRPAVPGEVFEACRPCRCDSKRREAGPRGGPASLSCAAYSPPLSSRIACSSAASLSRAAFGSWVPEIAALTCVEWTFRSFAYSGRFQKSRRRGTESFITKFHGCASRNSGEAEDVVARRDAAELRPLLLGLGGLEPLDEVQRLGLLLLRDVLGDVQAHAAERHEVRVLLGQRREGQLLEDLLLGLAELGVGRVEQAAHRGDPLHADAHLALADRGVDLVDEPVARALRRERDHLVDEHVHRLLAGGVVDDALDLAAARHPTACRRRRR